MMLSSNAFCARMRNLEYFEKHGYSKGIKFLEEYPGVSGQMILVDSYDLYSFGYYKDGKIVCGIMDYFIELDSKISIEEAKEKYSMLFI